MPEEAAVVVLVQALGRHAIATCPHPARQPDDPARPWLVRAVSPCPASCSLRSALRKRV